MNIIFCDMGSFTYKDICDEMIRKGHSVNALYYHFNDKYNDEFFEERLKYEIFSHAVDLVFSVNFFPVIAKVCKDADIPYASWSYDSPLEEGFETYFAYDTNRIFLFDRAECEKYRNKGYDNVYHLPLAVNVNRLNSYLSSKRTQKSICDISFIGSLYKPYLDDLLTYSSDYIKGYIEGLFQSQINLFGVNLIEQAITDEIINKINMSGAHTGKEDLLLNKTGLVYAINRSITHSERVFLLNELSSLCSVHYYGYDGEYLADTVTKHGPVKYYSSMNDVFVSTKLNLCPTLRSISSGIPLRALDVVGCGATLFMNYQPEMIEFFEDGKNVIMYGDIEDAFEKAKFYLKNDEVRMKIGIAGRIVAEKYFNYSDRIDCILSKV